MRLFWRRALWLCLLPVWCVIAVMFWFTMLVTVILVSPVFLYRAARAFVSDDWRYEPEVLSFGDVVEDRPRPIPWPNKRDEARLPW